MEGDEEILVTTPDDPSNSSSSSSSETTQQSDQPNEEPSAPPKQPLPIKHPRTYAPPGANTAELEDDLSDFGFDQRQVKDLMRKREFQFDATMQRPHFQTREDRENERKRLLHGSAGRKAQNGWKEAGRAAATRDGQRPVKKRKMGAEGLVLGGSGNWILFDPRAHDLPLPSGREPPVLFQKYSRFEAGNARVVEINRVSGCVRLKSTPDSLAGKSITYSNDGPKISGLNQQPPALSTAQLKSQAPPPPTPKRGPSRPRGRGGRGALGGRGGRGNGVVQGQRENVSGGMKVKATITVRPMTRKAVAAPVVTKSVESDSGSESVLSESVLSEAEESIEVADSQGDGGEGNTS